MLMVMTPEAKKQRKIYNSEYREQNREKINQQQRAWRLRNQDKVREYQRRYWEKKCKINK